MASAEFDGVPLRSRARWYTEVTVHDTLQMKEHLPLLQKAGCRALWLGVEDMTAKLVNKGQSVDKTTEAFRLMRAAGICPMPMMMHHDSQPLYSRGSNYGLLNQINLLRKAGAVSLQVLMMTPSVGTKLFEPTFTNKLVIAKAGGKVAEPHMYDGNYVVASAHARPWRKQFNLLMGYLSFYNPLWFVMAVVHRKSRVGLKPAGMQLVGMLGLIQSFSADHGMGDSLDVWKDFSAVAGAGVGYSDAERAGVGGLPCAGGDGKTGSALSVGGVDCGGVRDARGCANKFAATQIGPVGVLRDGCGDDCFRGGDRRHQRRT